MSRRKAKLVPSEPQVALCKQRIRDVLDGCRFVDPIDLGEAGPRKLTAYLLGRIKLEKAKGGLSHQTAHFFLAAIQRFVWRLSMKRRVPIMADLFDDVPGFDPKGNRVHARRPITAEELAWLLEATQKGVEIYGLSGQDRYFLYLTAFATGFRAGELAHLAPENFVLNAEFPSTLPGKYTKNKKAAACPLPTAVAVQLQTYLAGKPAGVYVWRGKWRTRGVKILRCDLEVAGIPYVVEGPHGKLYADFHALRHSFVTALAAAGVGQKELQELARHSDPRLTLGLYTHTTTAQLAGAVGRLAIPGSTEAKPLAAVSRADLEAGYLILLTTLATLLNPSALFAPPLAPGAGMSGYAGGQSDTTATNGTPKKTAKKKPKGKERNP